MLPMFIHLKSGGTFDFESFQPDGPHFFLDMVHALSQINRFTGHTRKPYSVLQHSDEVAANLRRIGMGPKVQLSGLFHDFHEALIGDVSSPLKQMLPDYKVLEATVAQGMYQYIVDKVGPYPPHWDCESVLTADRVLVLTEGRDLLGADVSKWGIPLQPQKQKVIAVSPQAARDRFWRRLFRLFVELERRDSISAFSKMKATAEDG